MRRAAGLVLFAFALAGCGGSSESRSGTASPRAVLSAWYVAAAKGDAKSACSLMTARGHRWIEVQVGAGRGCAAALPGGEVERPVGIGPIGSHGDMALGVVRFQAPGSRAVAVLRREGERWLVDIPGPVPIPIGEHVAGVPAALKTSLPAAGPNVLGLASRWVDGRVQSGALNRAHVISAAAVGRVAVAYLAPGSDVSGASRPDAKKIQFLLIVKSNGAWHVIGLI